MASCDIAWSPYKQRPTLDVKGLAMEFEDKEGMANLLTSVLMN